MNKTVSFFLGTNSGNGFYSLFSDITDYEAPSQTFVIKGGPGTGKSGIMKKLADNADKNKLYCERLWCSSDPASLDGLFIPEKNAAICDGTAPHIVEPLFAGAVEQIVNVGSLWNRKGLSLDSKQIMKTLKDNGFCHKRVSNLLASAKAVKLNSFAIENSIVDKNKTDAFKREYLSGITAANSKSCGKAENRFLSGVTPDGIISFNDTVKALATDITLIYDSSGITYDSIAEIADGIMNMGYGVIVCHDVLFPEKAAHLIIPELKKAIVTSSDAFPIKIKAAKCLNAEKFCDKKLLVKYFDELQFNNGVINKLLLKCVDILKEAKDIHDKLETYYIKEMDFDALNALTDSLIKEIIG